MTTLSGTTGRWTGQAGHCSAWRTAERVIIFEDRFVSHAWLAYPFINKKTDIHPNKAGRFSGRLLRRITCGQSSQGRTKPVLIWVRMQIRRLVREATEPPGRIGGGCLRFARLLRRILTAYHDTTAKYRKMILHSGCTWSARHVALGDEELTYGPSSYFRRSADASGNTPSSDPVDKLMKSDHFISGYENMMR